MAIIDQSGIHGKIRNQPIAKELERVLERAADAAGIDTIRITSGGQPAKGEGGRRTGSTRHDHGRAADLQLVKGGHTLTFTDQDGSQVEAFVTAAAANGATGIGAGVGYMGNKTLHVGFGTSPQDEKKLVWGAGGRSANAPAWLRKAAKKGWDNPVRHAEAIALAAQRPGRFVVIARGGLQLRKGPGVEFGVIKTVETGAVVTVVGFDGADGAWARVKLDHNTDDDDRIVDGHMLAAFLTPADPRDIGGEDGSEDVEEPDGGEA